MKVYDRHKCGAKIRLDSPDKRETGEVARRGPSRTLLLIWFARDVGSSPRANLRVGLGCAREGRCAGLKKLETKTLNNHNGCDGWETFNF